MILNACSELAYPEMRRDHCAIYLGYYLGLRIGEAAILARDSFRMLSDDGTALIRTLKQTARIRHTCARCERSCRVSAGRIGQNHTCPRCGEVNPVRKPYGKEIDPTPPEKSPPVVERPVRNYILDYMTNVMRLGQDWFFEAQSPEHVSTRQLSRIFATYVHAAGLSLNYSWHALRHGRGMYLWTRFKDVLMVRDGLRQKSITSAEIYAHFDPATLEGYLDVLERDALDMGFEHREAAN